MRWTLIKLQKLRIIAITDGQITILKDTLHLPPESPYYEAYRTLLRLKFGEHQRRKSSTPEAESDYSFTVLFSANEEVRSWAKSEFLQFLGKLEEKVKQCEAESVYGLSFDLLRW